MTAARARVRINRVGGRMRQELQEIAGRLLKVHDEYSWIPRICVTRHPSDRASHDKRRRFNWFEVKSKRGARHQWQCFWAGEATAPPNCKALYGSKNAARRRAEVSVTDGRVISCPRVR